MAGSYETEIPPGKAELGPFSTPTPPSKVPDVFEERPDHNIHYKTLNWQVCIFSDSILL